MLSSSIHSTGNDNDEFLTAKGDSDEEQQDEARFTINLTTAQIQNDTNRDKTLWQSFPEVDNSNDKDRLNKTVNTVFGLLHKVNGTKRK